MRPATTTRQARAVSCALLLCAAPAVGATREVGPAPELAIAAPTPNGPRPRWHVELAGAAAELRDLRETSHSTPAPETEADVGSWERTWKETAAWLSLSRDVVADARRDLRLGLRLGAAFGRFSAGNDDLRFLESWRVRPALSWGATAAGEIRRSPGNGPFLRGRFDYSRARADEDSETVQSTRGDTSGLYRDARFAWHETGLSFRLGWRRGSLAVLGGVDYRRFILRKAVRYHIPVPLRQGPEAEIVRALNSSESSYDYRNRRPWKSRLGLEWRHADAWLVAADCALSDPPDCRVALGLTF